MRIGKHKRSKVLSLQMRLSQVGYQERVWEEENYKKMDWEKVIEKTIYIKILMNR